MKKSLNDLCPKFLCEICGETNKSTLHRHHIIPKTELNCTNHHLNLCVICSNCHNKVHAGLIKIIGVFPSTKPPSGRTLVYIDDKGCNVPGMEDAAPCFKSEMKAMKIRTKDET